MNLAQDCEIGWDTSKQAKIDMWHSGLERSQLKLDLYVLIRTNRTCLIFSDESQKSKTFSKQCRLLNSLFLFLLTNECRLFLTNESNVFTFIQLKLFQHNKHFFKHYWVKKCFLLTFESKVKIYLTLMYICLKITDFRSR